MDIGLPRLVDERDHVGNESEKPITHPDEQHMETKQSKVLPRVWYLIRFSARKSFSICHIAGERLAWCFGITKPKYHAEMQHYNGLNEEKRQAWRQAFQDVEHTDHIRNSIR